MARAWRIILLGLAWVCVAVGVVGIVTPGLPGTVFLIIAAGLFARASPRLEAWLLAHPKLGPSVRRWRENGIIPRPAKIAALASMAGSLVLLVFIAPPIATGVAAICIGASALFVATRPNA